jgi:hypothetical protein
MRAALDEEFNKNPLLTDSNVNENNPKGISPADKEWGIDTVTISFKVDLNLCSNDPSEWTKESTDFYSDSQQTRHNLVKVLEKEYANVRISFLPKYEKCSITFNSARLLSPKSRSLCPPSALKPLVAGLLDEVKEFVWPQFDYLDEASGEIKRDSDWASQVSFTRLDAARNLFIDDIPGVKQALPLARPKYWKGYILYLQPGESWTLVNTTERSGKDRVYDKDAELANHDVHETIDTEGAWFRFECQLQEDRLLTNGLKTLDKVTDERVWEAIAKRWDYCQWGVNLYQRGTIQRAIQNLSANQKQDLVGFLALSSMNELEGLTPSRIRTMNALARSVGLTPGITLDAQGIANRKLSLWEGRIVALAEQVA